LIGVERLLVGKVNMTYRSALSAHDGVKVPVAVKFCRTPAGVSIIGLIPWAEKVGLSGTCPPATQAVAGCNMSEPEVDALRKVVVRV
jgi:hypothetical protein